MSSQVFFPLGFRFKPSIKTLILDYLKPKIKKEQLPCTGIIIEDRNLYTDVPWNLLKEEEDRFELDYLGENIVRTFYVFTQVTKVGSRFSRTVLGNQGTWKGETGLKKVTAYGYNVDGRKEKIHIGFKRLLKFQAFNQDGDELRKKHGDWLMHEYSLGGVSLGELELGFPLATELVVCKVKQTIPKKRVEVVMTNPNSLARVDMVTNKRKLTTESDLPGETTKKISDFGGSVISNLIPGLDKRINDCVEPASTNNAITYFNSKISDRVTSQLSNATASFYNGTSDRVGPVSFNDGTSDSVWPVSLNNGKHLDIEEENFSEVEPRRGLPAFNEDPAFDEDVIFSYEEIEVLCDDRLSEEEKWILINGPLQQPDGSMGSNINFPLLDNPNSQPSVGGPLYQPGYAPNASQGGYAMDYVTQGAQGEYDVGSVTQGAQRTQGAHGGYAVNYVTRGAQGEYDVDSVTQGAQGGYGVDYVTQGAQGEYDVDFVAQGAQSTQGAHGGYAVNYVTQGAQGENDVDSVTQGAQGGYGVDYVTQGAQGEYDVDFVTQGAQSTQGAHDGYAVNYVTQGTQGGYGVDYVTQGAQSGSQAGYSRFGSRNEFMSQGYMAHGSQRLLTQAGFNDPSQDNVSQGHFNTNSLQTQVLMNPLYSEPFAHYDTRPPNMQPQQQQQQQQAQQAAAGARLPKNRNSATRVEPLSTFICFL